MTADSDQPNIDPIDATEDGEFRRSEFDYLESDDYYACFNVPSSASSEEITNAYRRLSRVFHPDKHSDATSKVKAENLFTKLTKAYEVLMDPQKRMIYDLYGVKGLKTEGWEIVERKKTPTEIAEEYRQLREAEKTRQLEQATNAKTSINVAFDMTDIFDNFSRESLLSRFFSTELKSLRVGQQVDFPITDRDTMSLGGNVKAASNGNGFGNALSTYRRVLDEKTWLEAELAVGSAGHLLSTKVVRTISPKYILTSALMANVKGNSLALGMQHSVTTQLSKHLLGRMTWSAGLQSNVQIGTIFENEKHYANAGVTVGWRGSYLDFTYVRKFRTDMARLRLTLRHGTNGSGVEIGCEKQVSKYTRMGSSLLVNCPGGIGVKVKLLRNNQVCVFQFMLSEEVLPSSVLYGSVLPLVVYAIMRALVFKPWQRQQAEREAAKKQEENLQVYAEKKATARSAISLMQETYCRIRDSESGKLGLVIIRALYGRLPVDAGDFETLSAIEVPTDGAFIDVTVPVQTQAKDSKLIIPAEIHKSNLEGFYDPCYGNPEKVLYIRYLFRGIVHETIIGEREAVRIPQQRHRLVAG